MTKVSSGKPKQGPPAHQNSYAFHHNKSSKLTKHIGSLPIRFLCPACVAVIEWRKKYRKYKPLTVVKKCTVCGEKKIKDAYHVICGGCVGKLGKCGKCLLLKDQWIMEGTAVEINESGEIKNKFLSSNITDSNNLEDEDDLENTLDSDDLEDTLDSDVDDSDYFSEND